MTDETRVLAKALIEHGIGDTGVEGVGGGNIHGWRCHYPDRYGSCTCVIDELPAVLASVRARGYVLVPTATLERARRIEEAARAHVNGAYQSASGVVGGPEPKPEDFTPYVSGEMLAVLRAALSDGGES